MTLKYVRYVLTAADIAAGVVFIPVLWNAPFVGTNYAVAWSLEVAPQNIYHYLPLQLSDKSGAGFNAIVGIFTNLGPIPGEILLVNAMAQENSGGF